MSEQVLISDYFWFQEGPGVRNAQYRDHGVKLLNVSNLTNGSVDLNTSGRYISEEEAYGKYRHFLVDEGDFIIASSGIRVDYFDRKMGFVSREQLPLCMNTSTIRFKSLRPEEARIRYLMYYLKSNQFKEQLKHNITGSAQLNFGPTHLKKMYFPLIPADRQDRIVRLLDQISLMIAKREQQLEKIDQLVKSHFVGMFGDPVSNSKGLPLVHLSDLGTWKSGGTPARSHAEYYTGSIPWYAAGDLNEKFLQDSAEHITAEAVEKSPAKIFRKGSMLVGMYDTAAFKMGILQEDSAANQACADIAPNDSVNIEWLYQILQMMRTHFLEQRRGCRQKNLSLGMIKNFEIPYARKAEQDQFVRFTQKTDRSVCLIQQSIEKLKTLQASLMQQYFG